jgi:signal transduction histidine kinase
MQAMLEELLDSAQLQQGHPLCLDRHPTDLVERVRQAVLEYGQVSDLHTLSLHAMVPSLFGNWDAARLDRVLSNLLTNAVKYSPHGGAIDVAVGRHQTADRAEAVVEVRDHGIGIPAGDLPHLFAPFFRASNATRVAGTGLGLYTAQQIVQQHGGRMSVASTEGSGTTFTVHLPLASHAQQQHHTTPAADTRVVPGGQVVDLPAR